MFDAEVEIYGQAEICDVLFDGPLTRSYIFRKTPVFDTMALLARSVHMLVDAGVVVKNEDMYSLAPGHTPLDLVQDNFPQAKVAYILWANREAPPLAPPDLAEYAGIDDPKRIHSILSALETKHAVVRAGVKGRPKFQWNTHFCYPFRNRAFKPDIPAPASGAQSSTSVLPDDIHDRILVLEASCQCVLDNLNRQRLVLEGIMEELVALRTT